MPTLVYRPEIVKAIHDSKEDLDGVGAPLCQNKFMGC